MLRQQYLRAIPTVHADAIRAQRNQALSTLDTGLERAVEEQDEGRGLSLIGHLVDNGILSKQQGEERQAGFQTAFRAKGEQLAIDGAFHFARSGDLDGAREQLNQIDPKRRSQVEDDVLFTYRSMENVRDVSGLIDRGKYRKAAVKLARRNPNGTFTHWRNLSDSRRDELLEQATGAYIDELKPVMVEALKRRREGSIETRPQLRKFFRERGQKLTPLFEEIADLDLSGRFDTAAAKSSFFHRKIAGYEPEEDRGRVRYHNLLAALEVSGLPENKAGTLAERLTRIADGDAEALEEQYTRREFDRRIGPAVRKTGGRVRADRVKRLDDPERGTIYYTDPTDEERNDPAIAIESLRTRGFENKETESEESLDMPLVPEESTPPLPTPEALSNEEAQLEPPESPLTEAEAEITVTNPDIPLSEPAPPIEARVLQLSPDDQAVLNGTLLGNEEVTDLIQWDREERMANFLQDKYVTGLRSGKYNSIEAAAKDMGRFVGSNTVDNPVDAKSRESSPLVLFDESQSSYPGEAEGYPKYPDLPPLYSPPEEERKRPKLVETPAVLAHIRREERKSLKRSGSPEDLLALHKMDLEDSVAPSAYESILLGRDSLAALAEFEKNLGEDEVYQVNRAGFRTMYRDIYDTYRKRYQKHEATIGQMYRDLNATMGIDRLGGEKRGFGDFASQLIDLPKDERGFVIASLITRGEAAGKERKSFGFRLAENIARGTRELGYGLRATGVLGDQTTSLSKLIRLRSEIQTGHIEHSAYGDPKRIVEEALDKGSWIAAYSAPERQWRQYDPTDPNSGIQEAVDLITREIELIELNNQIRQISDQSIDPSTSDNVLAQGILDFSRSLPNAAAIAATRGAILPAVFEQYSTEAIMNLKQANPDLSDSDAAAVSLVSSSLQSGLEIIPAKILTGKLVNLNRWRNQAIATTGGFTARYMQRVGLNAGAELLTENIQNLLPHATQEVFAALDKDVPHVDWEARFGELARSQPQIFWATLPLALVGAGVGTTTDFRTARDLMTRPDFLVAAHFNLDTAKTISQLASDGKWKEAESLMRAEFQQTGGDLQEIQTVRADSIERLTAAYQVQAEAIADAQARGLLPTVSKTETGWQLTTPRGETLEYDSVEQANADIIRYAEYYDVDVPLPDTDLNGEVLIPLHELPDLPDELDSTPDVDMVEVGHGNGTGQPGDELPGLRPTDEGLFEETGSPEESAKGQTGGFGGDEGIAERSSFPESEKPIRRVRSSREPDVRSNSHRAFRSLLRDVQDRYREFGVEVFIARKGATAATARLRSDGTIRFVFPENWVETTLHRLNASKKDSLGAAMAARMLAVFEEESAHVAEFLYHMEAWAASGKTEPATEFVKKRRHNQLASLSDEISTNFTPLEIQQAIGGLESASRLYNRDGGIIDGTDLNTFLTSVSDLNPQRRLQIFAEFVRQVIQVKRENSPTELSTLELQKFDKTLTALQATANETIDNLRQVGNVLSSKGKDFPVQSTIAAIEKTLADIDADVEARVFEKPSAKKK